METTHQTNGKSHLLPTSTTMPAPLDVRPGQQPASARYSRLLDLVRDAVDLELRLKATMAELEQEMKEAGQSELPSVLVSMLRHPPTGNQPQPIPAAPSPVIVPPPAPKPSVRKVRTPPAPKNMGGAWKAKVLGLMSDKKERKSSVIVKELKAKNATTIYSILCDLVEEGHLIRTRFAHYRLKLRA